MAFPAASRASPASRNSRTSWNCRWPSRSDSICRTPGTAAASTPDAVGMAMRAGAPLQISTSPARSSVISASRIAGRPTPKRACRSRSGGSRSPGLSVAAEDLSLEVGGHLLEQFLALDQLAAPSSTFHAIMLDSHHASGQHRDESDPQQVRPSNSRNGPGGSGQGAGAGSERGPACCRAVRGDRNADRDPWRRRRHGRPVRRLARRAGDDVTLVDVSAPPSRRSTPTGSRSRRRTARRRSIPGAGDGRPGLGRPGRPDRQLRQMLPHRGGGPRGAADDRPGHRRPDACRTAGATPPASPRSSGAERVLVGLTYHSGTLLGAGPRQASRQRHDLHGRARRRAERRASSAVVELFSARRPRRDRVERRACSTRSGRSSRSTAARCRPPALLRFHAHELVAHDGTQPDGGAARARWWRSRRRRASRSTTTSAGPAITGLLEKAVGGKASMLQDVEAGGDRDRGHQRRHRRRRQARRRRRRRSTTRWSGWSRRCRSATSHRRAKAA